MGQPGWGCRLYTITPDFSPPGFDHLVVLGRINETKLVKDGPDRYPGNYCKYYKEFRLSGDSNREDALLIESYSDSLEVKPNTVNAPLAISKNDVPLVYPDNNDKFYLLSLQYTWVSYSPAFCQGTLSPEACVSMDFNSKSSAGIIGKRSGLPKTAQFIGSSVFNEFKDSIDYLPLKIINFKPEFLSVTADLSRNKIRLVDSEDKTFLYKQKFLYDNQNQYLIDNCVHHEIKYGLNKQYGGFNALITKFECCYLLSLSDVSGYDKTAYLRDVYRMRNRGLQVATDGRFGNGNALVDYVTHYTVNPVRILWDGRIIQSRVGNSSGQNNTTADNSILHIIISYDLILQCFYHYYDRMPYDYNEFKASFELAIYSDDKILGLKFPVESDWFKDTEISVYKKYGMTLKATASRVLIHTPHEHFLDEGLEFLGSTSVWYPSLDSYLPVPRVGKLATSLTRVLNEDPILAPREQFDKVNAIFELLVGVEPKLRLAVARFLVFIYRKYQSYLMSVDVGQGSFTPIMGMEHYANQVEEAIIERANCVEYLFPLILGWECAPGLHFFPRSGGRWFYSYTMNKAAKAEAKLAHTCQELGISQAGKFWLDYAVDPFKDLVKPHPGYVDKTSNPSVVELVKKTVVIVAPGAVNWDCCIFLDQVLQIASQRVTTSPLPHTYQSTGQGATTYYRGGLNVRKANSGTPLDITTADNVSVIEVEAAHYTDADCRVIAIGMEVHDTTQELKKQGNVVVFRVDQPTEQPVTTVAITDTATACIPTSTQTIFLTNPPFTSAEALDILGSQQWEAREGVYVVPTQVQDTNPPLGLREMAVTCTESGVTYYSPISNTGAANAKSIVARNTQSPWSMCGAFFSGLDPAATLTVNLNYLVERFPNKTSAIRRLCYPSPEFDPTAMELYSQIARNMPIGVPVSENGLGDWIMGIANLAAGALSVIPHPIPRMIGAAITRVGNNKQVQAGVKQLLPAIEKKIEDRVERRVEAKLEKQVLALPMGPSKSVVQSGNYVAVKKGPRPNRTKKMLDKTARAEVKPANPWRK